jgi:hypothetical protein
MAKQQQNEDLEKSVQTADLLVQDVKTAHRRACDDNPLLAMVLRDCLEQSVALNRRLSEILKSVPSA